jgi:hypothetical protein
MLPKFVSCDQCDQKATVRGYGRIEFDWPTADDPTATLSTKRPNRSRLHSQPLRIAQAFSLRCRCLLLNPRFDRSATAGASRSAPSGTSMPI